MNQDPLAGFSKAERWSLLTGDAGRILILVGLALFVIAAIASALSGKRPSLRGIAGWSFGLGAITLFSAFACLMALFVRDQFQFQYVFSHGDIHTPLSYKISGVWSGQQGSFLLWAATSAIFCLLTLRGTGRYRPAYLAIYSSFLATLCGILAYETPFGVIQELVRNGQVLVPPTGQGMAPSLMNYWMVIHPPTIFLGFGSLTVLFAYAVSAILHRDLTGWIQQVRPWALVTIAILGLGICMGGFWAYETLGWGGFWAWDPVENASFVPWIFTAAFVHGLIVQAGRKRWHGTNLILGALPFLTFCYGTFLTRGGFLDKVSNHSFASMNKSALVILEIFLGLVVAGFIAVYLWRGRPLAREMDVAADRSGIDRESLYGTGTLFLSMVAIVLALGMSWPLVMALAQRSVSKIEEGLYHKVVVWFFVPIILGIAITPFVSWRGMGAKEIWRRVGNIFSIAVGLTGATLLALRFPDWGVRASAGSWVSMPLGMRISTVPWIGFLLLLCAFAFVANLWRTIEMGKKSATSVGGFVAHLGLATLFAGLILSRGLEQKERTLARPNRPETLLGYTLTVDRMEGKSLFDREGILAINVKTPEGESFRATPGLYYQPASEEGGDPTPVVWPYIRRYPAHDFYLSLGGPILTLWEQAQTFHVGETKTLDGVTVTYKGLETSGQLGSNAVFSANLEITTEDGTVTAKPSFGIRQSPTFAPINKDLSIVMPHLDAADKSVDLQIYFSTPVYPIEVFTKPLTGLVWAGTGILTLGGLISAYARRRRKIKSVSPETTESEPEPIQDNAPVPVTQS